MHSHLKVVCIAAGFALGLCGCEPDYPISIATLNDSDSFRNMINQSESIVAGTMTLADRKTMTVTLRDVRVLKGQGPAAGACWILEGSDHISLLRRHIVDGAPMVVFRAGSNCFAYINRIFVEFYGIGEKWTPGILEGQWNQVYNGSVVDLPVLVENVLKGKVKPPRPDRAVPPIDVASLKALPDWNMKATEADLPYPFRKSVLPPVPPRPPDQAGPTMPGVQASLFPGSWTLVPSNASEETRVCEVPGSLECKTDPHLTIRFDGFLEIPKDGDYTLTATCDPDCHLDLKIAEVTSGPTDLVPEALSLAAGKHAVTVEYSGVAGPGHFRLFWSGPDLPKEPIPGKAWSHSR
jgi:hypothetical protein